ncbi:MAG: hypothetical protein JXB15_06975 [Anaerolineales bacterium]|nr:hypothetical protein [Anaerolineales bacterium]
MSTNSPLAKTLRFVGIILMGLTGGFTLLGGIGTTCVALAPTRYESMKTLAPFQWLYILFVLTGIALGVLGIRATIMIIKGADKSYRYALFVLVSGTVMGFIHMVASRALRGKSMPVDAVVYTTILTLVIFLFFRIPSIWQIMDFTKGDAAKSNRSAGGVAAILLGLFALTIQHTMGATHTWNGINYADAFNVMMTLVGMVCLLSGAALLSGIFDFKPAPESDSPAAAEPR